TWIPGQAQAGRKFRQLPVHSRTLRKAWISGEEQAGRCILELSCLDSLSELVQIEGLHSVIDPLLRQEWFPTHTAAPGQFRRHFPSVLNIRPKVVLSRAMRIGGRLDEIESGPRQEIGHTQSGDLAIKRVPSTCGKECSRIVVVRVSSAHAEGNLVVTCDPTHIAVSAPLSFIEFSRTNAATDRRSSGHNNICAPFDIAV